MGLAVRRKAKSGTLVQTGLRLEAEILDRLRGGSRGLSDEIRDRLERTFAEELIDAATRELREFLANIAADVRADFGCEWHVAPRAHEAFAAAVAHRIAAYAAAVGEVGSADDLLHLGPDEPPAVIGRLRERDDRRTHDYPQLRAAVERAAKHLRAAIARTRSTKEGEGQ